MVELLMENWFAIVTAIVAFASVIAKITPNETDNMWIEKALKFVDFFALTTGKTK